jgi:hypothetical protein
MRGTIGHGVGLSQRRGAVSHPHHSSQRHRCWMRWICACALFTTCITIGITYIAVLAILSRQDGQEAAETLFRIANQVAAEQWNELVVDYSNNATHSNKQKSQQPQPLLWKRPEKPIVIGYAISLIKCGDFQSSPAGLTDAAIVLRHSVHLTSARASSNSSNYDYKMFAIVHTQAQQCVQPLEDAGFHTIVRDAPVKQEEIQGEHLRKNIHREWCCGHDEFVKLYAYTIFEVPIVVHVDIDFIFLKPMDDLFDAMLYHKDSDIGKQARANIPVEFPDQVRWPENIQAFMTRDWPQVIPGRKAAYQAGFLIAKPNQQAFDITVDVVRKGDYVPGYGRDNGWGGQGYGAFVGAMAMQGLLAYTYDVLFYDSWVELNQCRFNHMGMDVLYRNDPAFRPGHPKVGKCRNDRDTCEDCMHTEVSKIYNIHYTQCRYVVPCHCCKPYPPVLSFWAPSSDADCCVVLSFFHTENRGIVSAKVVKRVPKSSGKSTQYQKIKSIWIIVWKS